MRINRCGWVGKFIVCRLTDGTKVVDIWRSGRKWGLRMRYKTVTMATIRNARISFIIAHSHCWYYVAPFLVIWNYSDNCCHGYHAKYVFLSDFDEFVYQLMYVIGSFHGNQLN